MSELKAVYAYTSEEVEVISIHAEGDDYYLKSEADKVIRHNKYKRCLAMAKWCLREYLNCDKYKITFWLKWRNRWLKLADKFKEAK